MGDDLLWVGLLKRCALSLEWKRVKVIDGESGGDGAGKPR